MNKTQQLYQDFRLIYGKLLLPHGFTFKNHSFYRRHADDVLLEVSIFSRVPYFDVIFEAHPFSFAYTDHKKGNGLGVDWFMANRAKRIGQTYERQLHASYESKMERIYHAFSTEIFPEFNKVRSLDTYLSYQEWFISSVGQIAGCCSDFWPLLQQKNYGAAYQYIQEYLAQNASEYAEKVLMGNQSSPYVKNYELLRELARKIDAQCYGEIDDCTQSRVMVTCDTCKRLGILPES